MKYIYIFLIIFSSSCSGLSTLRKISSNTIENQRPNINDLDARNHQLGETWEKYKKGQVDAVLMYMEMYPNKEIFFLARDAEYLYDTARLLYKDDPKALSRIKKINVSRANMNDPNLIKYLAQEGVSEDNLKKGKSFVFIDSGFHGTIVDVIKSNFDEKFQDQLHGHFLSSANFKYPSSRVFLQYVTGDALEVARTDPASYQTEILKYEKLLPHFNERSDGFEFINGKWTPKESIDSGGDGKVSSSESLKYMEDLKFYIKNSVNQEDLEKKKRI